MDFCQAILTVQMQFQHRLKRAAFQDTPDLNQLGVPIFTHFEDIEHRHHTRFDELASLCRKILKKLDAELYKIFTKQIDCKNQDFELKEE